jgi:hypothetical protein
MVEGEGEGEGEGSRWPQHGSLKTNEEMGTMSFSGKGIVFCAENTCFSG